MTPAPPISSIVIRLSAVLLCAASSLYTVGSAAAAAAAAAASPAGPILKFSTPHILVISGVVVLALTGGLVAQRRARHQMQARIDELNERAALASSGTFALWSWNARTDQVWATENLRGMMGIGNEQPLTRELLLAAVHPADRALTLRAGDGAASTNETVDTELRLQPPGGDVRWVMARARISRDAAGAIVRMTGFVVDISERKRTEAELLQQRQQLSHLTRVAILGELSGAIAHELNQPLTSILSNAQAAQQLLARAQIDVQEIRETLQDIISEDKRAGEVIRRLRALLTQGETQFQGLEVQELVRDVLIVAHGDLVRRNVVLQTKLEEPLPPVLGNRVELQQVLLNLVLNACEAMSANAPAERQIQIEAIYDVTEGVVRVCVSDHGRGLLPGQLERMFDPFFTTKVNGLGLGLAISRSIIVAHRGRLWATNSAAGGAAFHFTIPVLQREESHEHSTAHSVRSG
jgi:two-component system, LuxR family, sensor kinase FixL